MSTNDVIIVRSFINKRQIDAKRHRLERIDLRAKVSTFRAKTAQLLGEKSSDLELVYCGRCLSDNKTLDCYDVKTGSTVYALKKHKQTTTASGSKTTVHQIKAALLPAIVNQNRRLKFQQLANDSDTLKKLVDSHRSVADDPLALAILQDMDLLSMTVMAEDDTANRLLEAHPRLGDVILQLAQSVSSLQLPATQSDRNSAAAGSVTRSADGDNDDDDDSGLIFFTSNADVNEQGQNQSRDGAMYQLLRQILRDSLGGEQRFHQRSAEHHHFEVQLQQLRDMGVTDEQLMLQALQQSGGDVSRAVEFIFW